MSKFLEKAFNLFAEIVFYIGVIAAPFGVKTYLQHNHPLLPEFICDILLYSFIFFFSCVEIYTHHRDRELEKENDKYRNQLKEKEKIATEYRFKYEKLLRDVSANASNNQTDINS